MKYFLLVFLVILLIILLVWYLHRRKWAIRKVKCTPDWEKLMYVNSFLKPFGFSFDLECDIVVTGEDVWQKDMGYTDFYDYHAPFFNMVMDAFPLYFDYDGKNYRIELWKGQYGITTGAEIGIYIHDDSCPKGFYRAATDDEQLKMWFQLDKKCNLFTRCDKTWWLTGFDVGVFSKPKNLKMTVCIEFPTCEMRMAFVRSLVEAGYSCCQLNILGNTVCFEYCTPGHYKPNRCHRLIKCIAQMYNRINCCLYMHLTRPFNRTLDKLTYLRFMLPCLYRHVIRMSIPRRKQKKKIKANKKRYSMKKS